MTDNTQDTNSPSFRAARAAEYAAANPGDNEERFAAALATCLPPWCAKEECDADARTIAVALNRAGLRLTTAAT